MRLSAALFIAMTGGAVSGCAAVGFAALGGAGAAGGYEAYQYSEMNQLEEEYQSGQITREEYEARRHQIEDSSIVQ